MNTAEVTEGNKLIAEFMGVQVVNNICERCGYDVREVPICRTDRYPRNHALGGRLNELKYHTSWDWLMPVYEKFVNLSFKQKSDRDEHQKHCRKLHNALLLPNIGFAHVFLSKGIEWYNKEQNPEASVASKAEESSQR